MGLFSWLSPERIAHKAVDDYFASEAFSNLLHESILGAIRRGPNDKPLTFVGFICKMAITMFDAAGGTLSWDDAKEMAMDVWRDFQKDEKIKFGQDGYDWDGAAASVLAYEYQINYWED